MKQLGDRCQMSYPYPNDYYSGHSGSSSGHHHTELQRTAYNTVKGKERARDDATRWTDPISVQAGVFEGKVVRSVKISVHEDERDLSHLPILSTRIRLICADSACDAYKNQYQASGRRKKTEDHWRRCQFSDCGSGNASKMPWAFGQKRIWI